MIFTIGHSTHSIPELLGLLGQHGIELIVDVRSSPYSRQNPQFARGALKESLAGSAIEYRFAGRKLGGRSADRRHFDPQGRVLYPLLAATPEFARGIEWVLGESVGRRLVLLCAEREPLECHRTLLVAPALMAAGAEVAHILADGTIESHAETMDRLMKLRKLQGQHLLHTQDELIELAIEQQASRFAYRNPDWAREEEPRP